MERKIFSTQIGGREVTVETGAYYAAILWLW